MKKNILLFLCCLTLGTSWAQSTLYQNDPEKKLDEARLLMDKQQYIAAYELLDSFLAENSNETWQIEGTYYQALAALMADQPQGEGMLKRFIEKYPNHEKVNNAYFEIGQYYFNQRNYPVAAANFRMVNTNKMKEQQRFETQFKLAYSYYQRRDYKNAAPFFDLVKRSTSEYAFDAAYFSGYVSMELGDFDKALVDFRSAERSSTYAIKAPYMITMLYYRQGYFNDLVNYTTPILKAANRRLENESLINLMTADALFELKRTAESAPYYERYLALEKTAPSREIRQKIGMAFYLSGEYTKAANNFKEVALVADGLGQNASYYLGVSYLKAGNKTFAITAFDAASKLSFDKQVQEEALFNYAKVNLEVGDFGNAINGLDSFLDQYPASSYADEANQLFTDALINTNDYNKAITHIEKMPRKSDRIKSAYQKVTFYKGTEFFNDGKYPNAVTMFTKSQTFPMDAEISSEATFWTAEAYALTQNYAEAIKYYEQVIAKERTSTSERALKSRYGMGYAYFNTKDYAKAQTQFKSYVDQTQTRPNRLNYEDALIRLADCYYVSKNFSQAEALFKKAILDRNPARDYAHFRLGVIYNFQNQNTQSIEELDKLIITYPDSRYVEDGLFQRGRVYMEMGQYQPAISSFDQLITQKPLSQFVPYALENRAVAYSNLQQYDRSVADYKRILDDYPTSANADVALIGLQGILLNQNKVEEFNTYLAKYKTANPENSAVENVEFEAAKNLYFNQSYERAIAAFNSYKQNYPKSALNFEANYFIADSYYRMNDFTQALKGFYQVVSDNRSSQVNRAIEKVAELEFGAKNYTAAITYFRRSLSLARNKRQEYDAFNGLMESYYILGNYDSTRFYSDKILAQGSVTTEAENKALLFKAKSILAEGRGAEAIDDLLQVINGAKDQYGAEAQYLLAFYFYEQKDFAKSIQTIFDFAKNFMNYEYWYGRSYLLLADNYIGQNELFQAKATLTSIAEKSPLEEIREEARIKLQEITENEVASTPSNTATNDQQ